jgi:hypothetical protein
LIVQKFAFFDRINRINRIERIKELKREYPVNPVNPVEGSMHEGPPNLLGGRF